MINLLVVLRSGFRVGIGHVIAAGVIVSLGLASNHACRGANSDPDADAYLKMAGIVSGDESQRVVQFVTALKTAGLWDLLHDGLLLRTNYQSNQTNPVSLRGVVGTNSGAVMGAGGLIFSGEHYAIWNMSVAPTCTVYAVMTTATNSSYSTAFSLVGGGGVNYGARSLDFSSTLGAVLYERQGTLSTNQQVVEDRNEIPVFTWDPRRHSIAFACDNHGTCFGWFDGANRFSKTLQSPVKITGSLDCLMLGAQLINSNVRSNYFKGTMELCLVFKSVLTIQQIRQVEAAVRWLDPNRENIIFFGDSRTEWLGDAGRVFTSYPVQLMNELAMQGTATWWQEGVSGRAMGAMRDLYGDLVKPRAPGKAVSRSSLIIWGGVNDLIAGISAVTVFNSLTNLCHDAKADGFVVWVATEPKPDPATWHAVFGTYWTSAMESNRVAFNNLIRSNQWIADRILDHENLIPNLSSGAGISNDGLHPNALGNLLIAQELRTLFVGNPVIRLAGLATGQFGLAASGGRPGGLYHVQATTNLVSFDGGWQCCTTNYFDCYGCSTLPLERGGSNRFFRIRIP